MTQQITNTILMVRPSTFRSNEETATNNYYQKENPKGEENQFLHTAQAEFDGFVATLRKHEIEVIVIEANADDDTPDAHFPNNWISFHENGNVALYPMFAPNRRRERRLDVLDTLEENGFAINQVVDYTSAEEEELFLEGTGSLLLDRINRKAYCALSDRADEELLIEFCEDFEYTPVIFTAYQTVNDQREPIYHTNVMMALGEDFAIICLDSIDDPKEKKSVVKHLKEDGKEVIAISEQQVCAFAGNMLQVCNKSGERYLVMSSSAHESLNQNQMNSIANHCSIIHAPLTTIETYGGGSARCMMAEIFLPKQI